MPEKEVIENTEACATFVNFFVALKKDIAELCKKMVGTAPVPPIGRVHVLCE